MRAGQDRLKERSLGWVGLGLGQPWVRVGNCESRFGTRVKVWIEKSSVGPGRPRVTNRLLIAEAYTNLKEVRKAMTWLRKRLRSQADFRAGLMHTGGPETTLRTLRKCGGSRNGL